MSFNPDPLDPVTVAVTVAGLVMGPPLARVIGPYAVIILASLVGAAWALGRRDPGSKSSAAIFLARMAATASLVTVGIDLAVGRVFGLSDAGWLLAPISLAVGWIGDDWPTLGKWVLGRIGRFIDGRFNTGGDGHGQ